MDKLKHCFVIMPFSQSSENHDGKYWTAFFEDFIKPSMRELDYDAYRSEASPENITKGIIRDLATSDLVLAVLTDHVPNVWYELGIRHTLRRGTVMTIQRGQKRPFDVGNYGVFEYDDKDKPQFTENLRKYIAKTAAHVIDGPVAEFLDVDIVETMNIALAKLHLVVSQLKELQKDGVLSRETVIQHVRNFQAGLPTDVQVSAVENAKNVEEAKIVFHKDTENIDQPAKTKWEDAGSRECSIYPFMATNGSRLRILQLPRQENRITSVAYHILADLNWMFIVEAHCYQQARSPLG